MPATTPVYTRGNIQMTGGEVANANIYNSMIDMNDQQITTVGDPIQQQDAVNLRYLLQTLNTLVQVRTIALTGSTINSAVVMSSQLRGCITLHVTGPEPDGPTAIFHATKSDPSSYGTVNRINAQPGKSNDDLVQLYAVWPPNVGPLLYKTHNVLFDGLYIIKEF